MLIEFLLFLQNNYPNILVKEYLDLENSSYRFVFLYNGQTFNTVINNTPKPPISYQFEEALRNSGITYP